MANQPQSTSSNYNQRNPQKGKLPSRNKKAPKAKVPKVARKAKVDNKQSAIINKLSKQVYSLQMSKYGPLQQNYHTLHEILIPTSTQPLCLDLTDFTCRRPDGQQQPSLGARVYQHTGGPVPFETSGWTTLPYENNYYWNKSNLNQVEGGQYLAKSCTYFVEVKGINSLDNTRVRFDVVAAKPNTNVTNPGATDNNLPNTLQYMKHLAEPMGARSNRINPVYFKKYMSKTVFINSTKSDSYTKGTTANIMRFSFKLNPNKLYTQQHVNPIIGGLDPQPEIPRGNFGPYSVSSTLPLWLIISTDDQNPLGDAVQVNMSRRVVWRDVIGNLGI